MDITAKEIPHSLKDKTEIYQEQRQIAEEYCEDLDGINWNHSRIIVDEYYKGPSSTIYTVYYYSEVRCNCNPNPLNPLALEPEPEIAVYKWQARLSEGNTFKYQGADKWETGTTTQSAKAVGTGDVNGDGRADLILQYTHQGAIKWQARLSEGNTFKYQGAGKWETGTTTQSAKAVGLADVNGDGRADLILQYTHRGETRWQARLSEGNTFKYQGAGKWETGTTTQNANGIGLGDVNGDGRADLVLQFPLGGKIHWQARLSEGNTFKYQGSRSWITSTSTPSARAVSLGDVNNDNKADLILHYEASPVSPPPPSNPPAPTREITKKNTCLNVDGDLSPYSVYEKFITIEEGTVYIYPPIINTCRLFRGVGFTNQRTGNITELKDSGTHQIPPGDYKVTLLANCIGSSSISKVQFIRLCLDYK